MREELTRKAVHEAIDTTLSGLRENPWLAQQIIERERTGEPVVKKKLSVSLVLAIVLVLIAVTALAVALLSPKEIVEQVAVPMAQGNDPEWRIEMDYSPEELAAFIQACNENGIDLDENHAIMEAIRNGEGYDEEEAIMAVCRVAFGGNYPEWTLAEQHWFQDMMVSIGWAAENHVVLPGPEDLSEEEARKLMLNAIRARFGEDLPLEDREQFALRLSYLPDSAESAWSLSCQPRAREEGIIYEASLDRSGNVTDVHSVETEPPRTPEERGFVYTLTEEEAVSLAAEGIRNQTGRDVPFEDPEKYHSVTFRTTDPMGWRVSFISHTMDWGRCEAHVDDSTHGVTIVSTDVDEITADNILARYRGQYGWYDTWDSSTWAEIAGRAADLPASTMAGRVVKATPWIAWHDGLLTRTEAEEQAFRHSGVHLGDVNCASLIDAQPHPIWKFRLLPWDESYMDSIVVEIDAVTGDMTDLDMYKSDHTDLEPSFHMITLRRIWSHLEMEENGPLYIARLAVLHRFSDMSFDMPELDSLPIFDLRYWKPDVQDHTVRFRSQWLDFPDFEVELDENGMAVRVEELDSSGTEPLPESLQNLSSDASMYDVDMVAMGNAQAEYGINDCLWPLDVQASVFRSSGRSVPGEDEMTRDEAVALAREKLPPEAESYAAESAVGVLCQRLDAGMETEKLKWTIWFMADPDVRDGWRVSFLDAGDPEHEQSIDIHGPGDRGNG